MKDIQSNEGMDRTESNKTSTAKWVIALVLGSGRIVSAAALQSLNINGAFAIWQLPKALTQTLAGTAAVSNSISNATTRITSIREKLTSKTERKKLTQTQECIVYTIYGIGVIDSLYFAANNFNAVVELRCNMFGETDCEVNFWNANPSYLVLAGYASASGLICFFAFNLNAIKKNAIDLTEYCRDFKNNVTKEKKLLLATFLIALLSSASTGAVLYYSTSKSIHDFFAGTESEDLLLKTQVPIAIGVAIIANLFSQVASGKALLTKLYEDPSQFVRQWFREPKGWVKARTLTGMPFFLLDAIFSGIGAYAGTQKFLKNFEALQLVIIILTIINAINTGFLYFAFNTRTAIDTAAKMTVIKKEVKGDEEKQPLLSSHSSAFFNSSRGKAENTNILPYPKGSSCLLL